MDFFGKYKRPKLDEGKMDSVSKTESAGYIPAEAQIELFIQAGRRLDQARKEQYDFSADEEVPDDFIDPTRSGGFDLADATQLGIAVNQKIENQAKKGTADAKKGIPVKEEAPEKKE